MFEPPPSALDAFQLRVELVDMEPVIWRQVNVPVAASLADLHEVLQLAFGWQNAHLHEFEVHHLRFGIVHPENEIFHVDERGAPLAAVARVGETFTYTYDLGDSWEHAITVVALLRNGARKLECTNGARACPPEDSGGPHRYAALLQALADPDHEEHAEMRRWVGKRFDPEKFQLTAVNRKLSTLSKRLSRALRLV